MKILKATPIVHHYDIKLEPSDEDYTSCIWAKFAFDCDAGILSITSDAGDFAYRWGYNENEDFMHLMCRINADYLLNKISSRTVFKYKESVNELIKDIERDGYEYYGIESEEQWSEIKGELLEPAYHSEESYLLNADSLIPDIELESIPVEKDYPYGAQVIVKLFEEHLQPEIRKEFR